MIENSPAYDKLLRVNWLYQADILENLSINLQRAFVLLIGPLLCSPGMAEDLDETKAVHAKEVAEARETVIQSWQEALTSAVKKNDQKAAGEYREWSEYFAGRGILCRT